MKQPVDFNSRPRHRIVPTLARWWLGVAAVQATFGVMGYIAVRNWVAGSGFVTSLTLWGLPRDVAVVGLISAGAMLSTVVLAGPLMLVRLSKLLGGLYELRQGIRHLTVGGKLRPIRVKGDDEVSQLAAAFNDMAGRLLQRRGELVALNAELEERVKRRTAELAAVADELERMAMVDQLTGLANRRSLLQHFEKALAQARRRSESISCLAIDLDGFKGVNDTLGHAVGDELLKLTADVLSAERRAVDTVGRLGGDEFVVVLPECDAAQAQALASILLGRFAEQSQARFAEAKLAKLPSMSVGIATRQPDQLLQVAELLHRADEAMYAAKRAGKGRAISWSVELPAAA